MYWWIIVVLLLCMQILSFPYFTNKHIHKSKKWQTDQTQLPQLAAAWGNATGWIPSAETEVGECCHNETTGNTHTIHRDLFFKHLPSPSFIFFPFAPTAFPKLKKKEITNTFKALQCDHKDTVLFLPLTLALQPSQRLFYPRRRKWGQIFCYAT